jgi:hypothetical protein
MIQKNKKRKNHTIDIGFQATEPRNICRKKNKELNQRCRAPKYYQDRVDICKSIILNQDVLFIKSDHTNG